MAVEDLRNMDLDSALSETEREEGIQDVGEAYKIYVMNGNSLSKEELKMYGENWLVQAYEEAADPLGFHPISDKAVFVNERTSKSTADREMTLKEFEIEEEDILVIYPDGKVAAD